MAAPNLTTATSQMSLMLQNVQRDIELSQNLDGCLDGMFSDVQATDMGMEKYRHPLQIEVGGIGGGYGPDGGSYFQGNGPKFDQMIVAPWPLLVVFAATELLKRIAKGGDKIVAEDPVAKMIADSKMKAAHYRNAYLQGYNQANLGTVDPTYAGGNVIQMANLSFGARLININDQLQVTDANYNVVGTVNVLDKQSNTVGGGDTITVDAAPGGTAAGYNFIPIGLASGVPIALQGVQYIVSPNVTGDYCGIDRGNSYVQAPAYNANGAFLTLGTVAAYNTRYIQALGVDRYKKGQDCMWYGHPAQRMSADILGFAKTFFAQSDGKAARYDIGPNIDGRWTISGVEVKEDSNAAIDRLYWLKKSTLRKVRYPGSQKFIPGPIEGMWWPRQSGGLYQAEYDLMYQDSVNYYSKLPWANGVIRNLGVQPSLANGS
jgi:hypothetical protein